MANCFVVSHKMSWRALLTAVENYNKSLEKLQDFFFNTKTSWSKTKTFIFVIEAPRDHISRTTSLRSPYGAPLAITSALHVTGWLLHRFSPLQFAILISIYVHLFSLDHEQSVPNQYVYPVTNNKHISHLPSVKTAKEQHSTTKTFVNSHLPEQSDKPVPDSHHTGFYYSNDDVELDL